MLHSFWGVAVPVIRVRTMGSSNQCVLRMEKCGSGKTAGHVG